MTSLHPHIFRTAIFILLVVSGTNCEKEKTSPRDFPGLLTLEVDQISENGARFHAELTERGELNLQYYGFVWSRGPNPVLDYAEKIVFSGNLSKSSFSAEITTTLVEGESYYVRSFIQTDAHTVYGNIMTFLSLGSAGPDIIAINPLTASIGDTIAISGTNFSFNGWNNSVLFDETEARVIYSTDTLIRAIVPDLVKATYDISVEVAGNRSTYDTPFEVSQPVIQSFYPGQLAIDDTVTISGSGFSHITESMDLKIGGIQSQIISSDKETVRAIIPPGLATMNSISLELAGKEATAQGLLEFLEPAILLVSPLSVSFGDTIHMEGENFSFIWENNQLYLNELQVEPASVSKSEISFILPDEVSSATIDLSCHVAGRVLTYPGITVKAPVIHALSPDLITDTQVQELVIGGENFCAVPESNSVTFGGVSAQVVSASHEQLTVEFPMELIPDQFVSVNDTFDVQLQVLDQSCSLENALCIDYRSRWTKMANFPGSPRDLPAAFSYQGKGYFGLGSADIYDTHFNDLWEYDPHSDTWSPLTPFPGPARTWATYFVIEGKLYVCCGATLTDSNPDNKLQDVWEYDISSDTWTQKGDFAGGLRMRAYGFSLNGKGYLGGGQVPDWTHQIDLWEYDPASDTWAQKEDTPIDYSASYETYAVGHNGSAYVLGRNYDEERYFWSYDPDSDSWTRETNKPSDQMEPTCFSLENHVYFGFGTMGGRNSLPSFYRYSPEVDQWVYLGFSGTPMRSHAAGFALDGKGYIIGGISSSFHSNLVDVWEFDPDH